MGLLDAVYRWYESLARTMLLGSSDWPAFPLFGVTVVLAVILAMRLATGLIVRVVPRLAIAVCVACHLTLLTAEYLATRAIRLLGAHPPGVVYAFGDALNRALPRVLDAIRAAGAWSERETRVLNHRVLLVVAAIVLIGLWNGTYCERVAAPCHAPSTAFTTTLAGWFAPTPPGQ